MSHILFAPPFFELIKNPSVRFCVKRCMSSNVCKRLLQQQIKTPLVQRIILREYKVALKIVTAAHRSLLLTGHNLPRGPYNQLSKRFFQTSVRLLQEKEESPKKKSKNEKKQHDDDDESDNEDEEQQNKLLKFVAFMFTSFFIAAAFSMFFNDSKQQENEVYRYISWQEFVNEMLAKGEVEQLTVKPEMDLVTVQLLQGAVIKGRAAIKRTYHMKIINVENFEARLREAEKSLNIKPEHAVPVVYEREDDASWLVLILLVTISLLILGKMRSGGLKMPSPNDMLQGITRAKFTIVDPLTGGGKGVKFSDVAGLKEAKVEINEFVAYLKDPSRYKTLGARVPKGVLLTGPPGCGKTMLAKAVATEASVPFLAMAGSEFIEMIGGLGAARVRDLFKEAGKRAPCIIYIDEIDAIGKKRSEGSMGGSSGEEEQTLNQLLVEMDGMVNREGVLMLASTNRADVLDKALLRPGRFDRHILIDYPTLIERKEIFEHHLKPIKLEKEPSFYSSRMAQLTPRFSGADIANVCNEGALNAARLQKKIVKGGDLEYAVERVVGGTEKRSQVMGLEERRVVAFHESGHALVGWLLKSTDALLKVTIVPRTKGVLGFAMNVSSDQKLFSTEELFERMCMALGGRVAESLVFNKVSTGAQNDLQKVTKMAYAQIRQFGLDSVVGPLSFPSDEELKAGPYIGVRPYSRKLQNTMDIQARFLVARAYKHTESVLNDNMDKLKLMADTLLKKETLNYQDVVDLIGPPPFGGKKAIDVIDFGSVPMDSDKAPEHQAEPNGDSNGSSDNGPPKMTATGVDDEKKL